MPQLVTVNDNQGRPLYSYDADARIDTADDGLAFFESQLTVVETTIYEAKYRNIIYQELVPVSFELPEYADSFTYYSYDGVTMGKFIGANAADLPESDLTASQTTEPLFYGGNSFGYSLDELRKSQQLRMPVDRIKGTMSRRGFEEHAQRVAFYGDADRGLTGLFNNANVQLDNSTTDWDTATPDEIIADMNAVLTRVWTNSAETHLANRLLLPSSRWAYISTQPRSTTSDTTILEYFLKNNLYTAQTGQPVEVRPVRELETAGAGSAQRMMAYEVDPMNLVMQMPIPWRMTPPQPDNLKIKVPCEYKFGGVAFRYPGSAAYRDFI